MSTCILILVLAAAVSGLIYYLHREMHRDCSCGCAGCVLAKGCKRAAICIVALLVALASNGVNLNHHCNHCKAHASHHCSNPVGCDHCSDCFFIHFDTDDYTTTSSPALPIPEAVQLPYFRLSEWNVSDEPVAVSAWCGFDLHAPPCEGRHILQILSKLSL